MLQMPPILHVDDLTEQVFDDIRDASHTYHDEYGYTDAFDKLRTLPERRDYLATVLTGPVDGELLAR